MTVRPLWLVFAGALFACRQQAIVGESFRDADVFPSEDGAMIGPDGETADLDGGEPAAPDAGPIDAGPPCPPCVTSTDCPSAVCAQFSGDTFCAPACDSNACAPDRACTPVTSAEGNQVSACIPITNICGPMMPDMPHPDASSPDASPPPVMCGVLAGPTVSASCHSCTTGTGTCQANGCYGGWYCNTQTVRCQRPPSPATCNGLDGGTVDGGPRLDGGPSPDGGIGPAGGLVDVLRFAVVGDTRPSTRNDVDGYPTEIITQIWQDVEAESPHPPFALSTGDYMFATPTGTSGDVQLGLYLSARQSYSGMVYYAMGNQECTGATASNCGPSGVDGMTQSYAAFLSRMMAPLNQTLPYYAVRIDHSGGAWTSKVVVVAANAWSSDQARWLDAAMAVPTTYTFVLRHEGSYSTSAPGVTPSEAILEVHPYTMLIAGHTHTLSYAYGSREVIVGNGGAPLSAAVDYGYIIAEQQPNGTIAFFAHDYSTRGVFLTFTVFPDGSPAD